MHDWLPDDHLAWFVLEAVGELGLFEFYADYRDDGWGRAAVDPQMMVALLLYAYANGERSSRRIEQRCREDVAFRVLTANAVPDHVTIARFRARHERARARVFTDVLRLCAEAGLVSVGLVALDGTKLRANASKRANRSYSEISTEVEGMLAEAAETDAAEESGSATCAATNCRRGYASAPRAAPDCGRPGSAWRPRSPSSTRPTRLISLNGRGSSGSAAASSVAASQSRPRPRPHRPRGPTPS